MNKNVKRPPVIALLGHVDHGKTTLLDTIRKTRVQLKEAGGITQSVGASVVTTKEGRDLTFIDTPGHAAFKAMRSQGAGVCDIALLIVAADDQVKPQTKEALETIKKASVPFIVVLTKTDLPSADVEESLSQLEDEQILFEGRGGETPYAAVSAKEKKGIDELLEVITLLWDVTEEEKNHDTIAVVIESVKSKGGVLVNLVVKSGSLKKGETYFAQGQPFKIKAIISSGGKMQDEALAGYPAQVLGFSFLPKVGTQVSKSSKPGEKAFETKKVKSKLDEKQIAAVVKAESLGALKAVVDSMPIKFFVIESAVGDVTENDVFLAKAADKLIFAFNVKVPNAVKKLADTEGVKVYQSNIIYKILEAAEKIIADREKKVDAKALIVASFPFNNKKIAGCRLLEGEISVGDKLELVRNEKNKGSVRVKSLKKGKNDVEKVSGGEEFGVLLAPQLDFETGDMLISYTSSSTSV